MSVKELRPKLDPETCSICGRRLLQGEHINWFVAPDSTRRAVCELCVPRAERVRWAREREGEEVVQLRESRSQRGGLLRRVSEFFGAAEPDRSEPFALEAGETDAERRRRKRAARRGGADEQDSPPVGADVPREVPRDVAAVPTGPEARLERGIELFNISQFPRTIAGLSRSLGDPMVAAANVPETNYVDVWVGWDLAWYSYRVTLGDPTEPVEQSGRGNDVDELAGVVADWNARADAFGRLFLIERESSDHSNPQNSQP